MNSETSSCTTGDIDDLLADRPVLLDDVGDSRSLIVAFGGIQGNLGMPVFEFFNLTNSFDVKKIYIRDIEQAWYQMGLPGIGGDFDSIVRYLRGYIDKNKIVKTLFVGNSMGGWAAIAAGLLTGTNCSILAFCPQTFIGKWQRRWHGDHRWEQQLSRVYRDTQGGFFDLRRLFRHCNHPFKLSIFFSAGFRLDTIHARRLARYPNVELISSESGGHRLIKQLRDSGKLVRIIQKELEFE